MTVNTIIFGPTGGVARHAVNYTSSHGAKVTLAMRDPTKPIDGITTDQHPRAKADLTDPASVLAAAKEAQAHSAFIYLIHGPNQTPKASIQALKDAGVKHVVLLSSYAVTDPIRDIPQSEYIAWAHAQVEVSLEEVFGEGNFTAVRPAYFASNTFQYVPQIKAGLVKEVYPDNVMDFLPPQDIGEAVGSLLLRETGPLPRAVELCGAQVVRLDKVLRMIGEAAGKTDFEIQHVDAEEGLKALTDKGLPEPIARYLIKYQVLSHENDGAEFKGPKFERGQKNVKELLGRDGMTVEQWIDENKQAFA